MKKVLIVSRRLIRKHKPINWVSEIYLQLLAERDIMPIIVPISESTKNILHQYLEDYAGLLMVEGGDLGPHYYGENYAIEELDEYDALKDTIETACFNHAYEHKKPIMGFCRGLHIINAMLGGTMYKDIHEENKKQILHLNYDNYDSHRHNVEILKNTPLHKWYTQEKLQVNTYHHQGIKNIAGKLKPMAIAEDGLIEGVYQPDYPFLIGLQFHPERMYDEHIGNKKIFDAYCDAVKKHSEQTQHTKNRENVENR